MEAVFEDANDANAVPSSQSYMTTKPLPASLTTQLSTDSSVEKNDEGQH